MHPVKGKELESDHDTNAVVTDVADNSGARRVMCIQVWVDRTGVMLDW